MNKKKKSLIAIMIEFFKKSTVVKVGAFATAIVISATCLGKCSAFETRKDDTITPDNLVQNVGASDNEDIEGPETGDANEDHVSLDDKNPALDTDSKGPTLGVVEGEDTMAKEEPIVEPEKEDNKKGDIVSASDARKTIKPLKNAINDELETYFDKTKTIADSRFAVEDIIYIEASNKGLEIGFTTDAGKDGGYSVITVGSANDSEKVKTLIGSYTSKAYINTMNASTLKDLVSICESAVEDSGISKNIDIQYLIPLTEEVEDLGDVVIAYYKSYIPNGENCKKVEGGYEYSAHVLIQDENGMKVENVTVFSAVKLGKNLYYTTMNGAIAGVTTEREAGI